MNYRVIVSAVIEKDGQILMGRKPKDVGPYPNTLHIPGGGVDLGEESLEDAVRREIREETALEVSELKRVNFDEDFTPNHIGVMTHYIFLVYLTQYKSGELMAQDDLRTLEWIPKQDLGSLPLTAPSSKLFRELGWIN